MSGVSLPPFELSLNKSFFQDKLRQPITASRRSAPLLSTEQISLLLSLLAIGVYQKAGAQDTDAELIITAQNNFGEVTQLILSNGKLYILTAGCELQFVRVATPADLAAINALSPLSLPEAELGALTYGGAVIVATLDTAGQITDQLQDGSTDFFTQPAALSYSYQVKSQLDKADLKTKGLADLAVTTSDGDVLLNIEHLTGTSHNDLLIGDAGDNILTGGSGDDVLRGGDGADTLTGGFGDDTIYGGAGADLLTGGTGDDKFELELADGARAADIITDFTTSDKIIITNPDQANRPAIANYGSLKDLLDAASLRLETDTTDTDDLNIIYNSGQQGATDEVVLVLDEFLATNDLNDLTLTQIDLV